MADTSWGGTSAKMVTDSEVRQNQHPSLVEAPQKGSTPVLVLTAGFAGAGKTTLAQQLAAELGWEVINKDVFQREYMAKGEKKEEAGWKAFNRLLFLVEEALLRGESLIVDTSNERPFIFEKINEMLSKMHKQQGSPRLMILFCIANKETRTQRLKSRGSVFSPYYEELPSILDDSELRSRLGHLLSDELQHILEDTTLFKDSLLHKGDAVFINTNQPSSAYTSAALHAVRTRTKEPILS